MRINDQLSQSNAVLPKSAANDDFLHLEDYDANLDAEFVKEELVPYLRDLYKDLLMRSSFRQSFEKKGRYRYLMETIPTILITHAQPGLLGVAAYATVEFG